MSGPGANVGLGDFPAPRAVSCPSRHVVGPARVPSGPAADAWIPGARLPIRCTRFRWRLPGSSDPEDPVQPRSAPFNSACYGRQSYGQQL